LLKQTLKVIEYVLVEHAELRNMSTLDELLGILPSY